MNGRSAGRPGRAARAAVCFLLAILLGLSGCGVRGPEGTDSGTQTEDTTTTGKAPEEVALISKGASEYTIVRANEPEVGILLYCNDLRDYILDATGCFMKIKADVTLYEKDPDNSSPEVLIGRTNRDASIAAYEELDASGEKRFIIRMDGPKLVIAGSDIYCIYSALCYLVQDLIGDGLVLPSDYSYTSSDIEFTTPDEILEAGKEFALDRVERVTTLSSGSSAYWSFQGGGIDGRYAYYGFREDENVNGVLVKVDLSDWSVVKTSEPIPIAHVNDITYDPKTGLLVISDCREADGWKGITWVDPETLTVVSHMKFPYVNGSIEYSPVYDRFIVAAHFKYYITDYDMNVLRTFQCSRFSGVMQEVCADERYIYSMRVFDDSGQMVNDMVVHNWEGNYVSSGDIRLPGEPENIFRIGDIFYVGTAATFSEVWKMIMLPVGFEAY